MQMNERLAQTLKEHGYSVTRPRQAVFAVLEDSEPQSMHEIVARCQGVIDRASAYRTIELFEQLGIAQRLQIGWKYKIELSDAFHHHHHHATCNHCGVTLSLPENTELEKQLVKLATQSNFLPQSHQLEIRGLCNSCQPRNTLKT